MIVELAIPATPAALKQLNNAAREKGWILPDNPYRSQLVCDVEEAAEKRGYQRITKRQMRSLIAPIIIYPYAWPGGCPMVYQFGNDILCPKCAKQRYRDSAEFGTPWPHEEGAPIECDECGYKVESAYGDPNEEE